MLSTEETGARRARWIVRRMAQVSLATTLLALGLTAPAMAAPPAVGTLIGTSGCQMVIGGSVGCTPAPGVAAGESAVVSPDGRNVYETSFASNSPSAPFGLAAFSRDGRTGALTALPGSSGCLTESGSSPAGAGTCAAVPSFGAGGDSANIAVTPDGKFVYVVSSNIIIILGRDPATGALTQLSGAAGCVTPTGSGPCQAAPNLADPQDVSISPDGRSLYVSELAPDGILVLSRDPSTGALSQVQCLFDAPAPQGCDTARDVGFAEPVLISPDGLHAFSSEPDSGISSLNRDPATGRLTQPAGAAGCISEDGTDGQGGVCAQGRLLEELLSMAISPDGHTVYAVASTATGTGGVAVLHVAPDGSLSQPAGSDGCISNDGQDQTGAANCAAGRALDGSIAVAISPDGRTLYVSNDSGDGGDGVATLSIPPSGGVLGQPTGTAGCTTVDGSSDGVAGACATGGPGLAGPEPGVVSPDGSSFYLPTFNGEALIDEQRETAPVCQPASASTAFMTPVTITLSCRDADGDPVISWGVATGPAHGLVNPVNQTAHTVQYFPGVFFSGTDSFTFTVNDGRNTSVPQTATITVGPRPPAPPPLPVPRLGRVRQSHARWREPGRTKVKHPPPVGTTFRFTLNTRARVIFTFTERLPGRTVGGKCLAPSRRNAKHRACTRTRARGSFNSILDPGINHRDFAGTIPRHGRLPAGGYTVTLTAKHNTLHSTPKRLRFTIVG